MRRRAERGAGVCSVLFIHVWSPDALGEPSGQRGQFTDRSVSVCVVTLQAPREEQMARCTGRERAFYSLFRSFSRYLLHIAEDTAMNQTNVDPASKEPRGTRTLSGNPEERHWCCENVEWAFFWFGGREGSPEEATHKLRLE